MINLTKGKVTAIICGVFALIFLSMIGSIGEDVKTFEALCTTGGNVK